MVDVTVEDKDISKLLNDIDFLISVLKTTDVLILNQRSRDVATKLNTFCRMIPDKKIYFYWTCDWGSYGMGFVDLQSGHKYLTEQMIKTDLKNDKKGGQKEKVVVEQELDFISLTQTLEVRAGKAGFGLTKRTNPVFILVHILLEFHETKGRFPEKRDQDCDLILEIQKKVIEKLGFDESILQKMGDKWWDHVYGSRNSVSTVLGSSIGQDIIRAVTGKEETFKNFVLLDSFKSTVYVEQIGK